MSRYRSRSPRPVERNPFPLMVVVPAKYLQNFEDKDVILTIIEKSRVETA